MKMTNEKLVEIVKEQCETIVAVLKRHAATTTKKKEMESYRTRACGKLQGIIEMTISIYAAEYVNDDNAYWQKTEELRTYEDEIEKRITKVFLDWYEEQLNND